MADSTFIQAYWPQIVTAGGVVVGYVTLKSDVKHQGSTLAEVKAKADAATLEAAKAIGSHDATNARIKALEESVKELKESQAENARELKAMISQALSEMKSIVSEISGRVGQINERVHDLDKTKLSTGSFRAITAEDAARFGGGE